VGTNIEKFGKPNNCCFCDDEENEFHLFIRCPRIERLWMWLYDFVLWHYDNVMSNDLTEWEKLIGSNEKCLELLVKFGRSFTPKPFVQYGLHAAGLFLMVNL
jgi:hypothetical protein